MPRFVIEREIPGAGDMNPQQLHEAARASCDVLQEMGPQIQWIESWVTGDKILCHYIARDESLIRAHAERSGFPANQILHIENRIDPTTAEALA